MNTDSDSKQKPFNMMYPNTNTVPAVDVLTVHDSDLKAGTDKTSTRDRLKESFTVCYLIMFGTAAITFIEAMRNNNVHARHIMNLETAVSLTAGFVYGMFVKMTEREDFDLRNVVYYRYVDWSITTPMLLMVLLLFLTFHSTKPLNMKWFLLIISLNYAMLWFGYQGERGNMDKRTAQTMGFAALFAMLLVIYSVFVHDTGINVFASPQGVVFMVFAVVWALYGVAAELEDEAKNKMYNTLDVVAKVFFGLGLWVYYSGVASL